MKVYLPRPQRRCRWLDTRWHWHSQTTRWAAEMEIKIKYNSILQIIKEAKFNKLQAAGNVIFRYCTACQSNLTNTCHHWIARGTRMWCTMFWTDVGRRILPWHGAFRLFWFQRNPAFFAPLLCLHTYFNPIYVLLWTSFNYFSQIFCPLIDL